VCFEAASALFVWRVCDRLTFFFGFRISSLRPEFCWYLRAHQMHEYTIRHKPWSGHPAPRCDENDIYAAGVLYSLVFLLTAAFALAM
jgi:hypothetical protein